MPAAAASRRGQPQRRRLGADARVGVRGDADTGPDRPGSVGDRAGHLAARGRLGRHRREGRAGRAGRGRGGRGDLLGHRRRLRRRPQREADRPVPGRAARALDIMVATKMGRRVAAGPGAVHAGQLPGLDRPVPGQPGRGHAGPGPAALPADPGLLRRRGLRRAGHPGRRAAHRRLRGQRGDLRRGADRDRPAGRGQRADHPQRVPAQAAGAGAAGRARRPGSASSPGCRWPRGCCPAGTPATPCSRPATTATTTGTARRSTPGRRSPAWTTTPAWTRPASSRRWSPAGATPAQAALRWIIQQPGVTTVIPGARNPEQARLNAAAAELAPLGDAELGQIEDLYDRRIRAQVAEPAGEPSPRCSALELLGEEAEHLLPAVHGLHRPVHRGLVVEERRGWRRRSGGTRRSLPSRLSSASCWSTCSGVGCLSSLPNRPSSGAVRPSV